ncbi:MAG: cyclase family protein [Phycisphaerales bacterium]|nr:cyclase family protein [Phycisphaerales bacterium]
MHTDWIDISITLSPDIVVWPGDPPFTRDRVADIGRGDVCNVSRFAMSAHTGTHVDAPLHFIRDGVSIERAPIEALVGPARVIAVEDVASIHADVLRHADVHAGERILLKTDNSKRRWVNQPFNKGFVHLAPDAAEYLAEVSVMAIGIDYLSIGADDAGGTETHRILLSAGIWIIESLDLSGVEPGAYDLVCLPLKIEGADGAPARAVLRALEG